MRVHQIWAENVRGITTKKVINPAPAGLTLIHAPNESGKTTLSEVLTFLFTKADSSKDAKMKSLVPIGKDVGPAMGATIEIGPDTYVITKQWLKGKKTELVVTGSRNLQLAGADAQHEIERIFEESLDSSFWQLLQLPQGDFDQLIIEEFDGDFIDDLQNLLDKLSTDTEEENAETLFEKVEKEYLRWFTATGRQTTTAGTQGRVLKELEDLLEGSQDEVAKLRRNITESAKVQESIGNDGIDLDHLKSVVKAHQINRSLTDLTRKLSAYTRLNDGIGDARAKFPKLAKFNEAAFNELRSLYPLEIKYSALTALSLKALSANTIEVQGQAISLGKGEEREIPLQAGLQITVPGVLEISYELTGNHDAPDLVGAHNRFHEILGELEVSNWDEAENLSRAYSSIMQQEAQLKELEAGESSETIKREILKIEGEIAQYSNWEELLATPPSNPAEIERLSKVEAVAEGRWIEINKQGWDQKLNDELAKIVSLEAQIARLTLQRDAIEKLYDTLTFNRENSAKNVAPLFAAKLNEIAKSFFGESVDFNVNDEFKIETRYKDGSSVPIKDLSTGAKEQLAILIRLTLSRLVQAGHDSNEVVPVFFDDEFGHTDPERLKEMAGVFAKIGDEQQFIFMTCYPDKFDDFKVAKKIDLLA